jgi:hypothetical protein
MTRDGTQRDKKSLSHTAYTRALSITYNLIQCTFNYIKPITVHIQLHTTSNSAHSITYNLKQCTFNYTQPIRVHFQLHTAYTSEHSTT